MTREAIKKRGGVEMLGRSEARIFSRYRTSDMVAPELHKTVDYPPLAFRNDPERASKKEAKR